MSGLDSDMTTRFVHACPIDDLPPGTARPVTVAGCHLALVNHDGIISAIDGDCPHAGGPLGKGQPGSGCVLACPWHGAVFDLTSGQPLRGPARKPVQTYQVRVAGGAVQVALPTDAAAVHHADARRDDPSPDDCNDRGGR